MATKILVLEAVSAVGQAIHEAFEQTTYAVLAPVRSSLDWTCADALQAYMADNDVSVVINVAGWSGAPSDQQSRDLVDTASALAQAAKACDATVIHLSSYRVFGAEPKAAYDEDDSPAPISRSGQAFLDAEQQLLIALSRCICLRVSWLLETSGDAVFHRLLQDLTSEGPELVVTHQRRGSPLPAEEVGRVVLAMVQQIFCGAENWGAIHLASSDPCSSAEVTEVVAETLDRLGALRRTWRVESLSEEQLSNLEEPESSVLTVRRCRDNFGYQVKSWRQGLSQLITAWLERHSVDWS